MELTQLNDSNCKTYLIGCPKTKQAALVDPLVGSVEDYLRTLERGGWTLSLVIDTHTHADHISGGLLLQQRTGADYAMHKKAGSRHPNQRLTDGSSLSVGELAVEAVETAGHTKDSMTLKLPGAVLTGDWLFIGGAGRTDLPGGDPGEHWDSLQRVIPGIPDETLVLPGHDYQDHDQSTMSAERKSNQNLQPPRTREEYVRWLESMNQPTPEWMIQTVRANNEGVTDPTVDFMPEGAESACMCQPAPAGALPTITVDEVHAALDDGVERLLLDVREPNEYTGPMGHVPGALLIPLGQLEGRLDEIESYRDKPIVAICRSGGRSAKATEILLGAGFDEVRNMTGGTLAWNDKGFPVDR